MRVRTRLLLVLTFLGVAFGHSSRGEASPVFYGPTPYLSLADSPLSGVSASYFYVETFEDGLLNAPGLSASGGGVLGPNFFVDSVDGDDGTLDGNGSTNGHSWYSNFTESAFKFSFDAGALGSLPTYAGLVYTDIGFNSSPTPWFAPVTFEAFDQFGVSLGILGPFMMGDGQDTGQAAEDRFFGVYNPGGISAISISTTTKDWEVDHVQYLHEQVSQVPEPCTVSLMTLGAFGIVRNRFRNRNR